MQDRWYIVKKENVYVGMVVGAFSLFRNINNKPFFHVKPGEIGTNYYKQYRSILFTVNENNLASDLLYDSPEYPILNITDDKEFLKLRVGSTIVKDVCNLSELLNYFEYDSYLTYDDIDEIRDKFFYGSFTLDNWELFESERSHLKKMNNQTLKIEDTKNEKNSFLEKLMLLRRHDDKIPVEYWDYLTELSDYYPFSVENGKVFHKKDAFEPSKVEGKVKRLSY